MDKESICVLDIYFEHYDNFKYNKEMYKDAYVISGKDLGLLEDKIMAIEYRGKFFEKQYTKCVDRYENKIAYYKNIAHVYKIELGRCIRKLTRIYKKLYRDSFLTYALGLTKIKPADFVRRYKNV